MSVNTINLTHLATQLNRPFELVEAAQVDEVSVYLYISHGRLSWHRHLDEDEVFLVLSGLVALDSEWGSVTLHAGELAAVPKGVGHRSVSKWRSTVLLLRPKLLVGAQNGHRRLYGLPGEDYLQKMTLNRLAADLLPDFSLYPLATVGAHSVFLQRGIGVSGWQSGGLGAHLLFVQAGSAVIEEPEEESRLSEGQMAVISAGARYRLAAANGCTLLTLARPAGA